MKYEILCENIDEQPEVFEKVHADPDMYGGSSVANICGLGFKSAIDEWLLRTGKVQRDPVNAQMRLGNFLEPFVLKLFEEYQGWVTDRVNQIWQDPERRWRIASPDAKVPASQFKKESDIDDEIVEIKTGRVYAAQYWEDGGASDAAMCQLQWYLDIAGLKGGYCVGMFGGDAENLFVSYVKADKAVQQHLTETVERFRECVQMDVPPHAGPGDAATIKEHLVQHVEKEKEVDLSESHEALLRQYVDTKKEYDYLASKYRKADKAFKAAKNQIVQASDGASRVFIMNKHFSISEVNVGPKQMSGYSYFRVSLKDRK